MPSPNDERGNEFRIDGKQLDAAAACDGREQARRDGDEAGRGLERVNHRADCDFARRNRHEDGGRQQDDAPVEALRAERRERRRDAEHADDFECEHDERRVDDGHVVAEVGEQQHGSEREIFRIQKIACLSAKNWLLGVQFRSELL